MKNRTFILLLRCLLFALICLQLYMIFGFSKENAQKSTESSERVTEEIAKIVVDDYEKLPVEEQKAAVKRIDPPVRKMAHAAEFAVLGSLLLFFFFTFRLPKWLPPLVSLLSAALVAALDEWHQTFVPGRSGEVRDILIDTSGALAAILILTPILFLFWKSQKRIAITKEVLQAPVSAKIAVVADLHGEPPAPVLERLKEEKPTLILVPGDLADKEDLEDENNSAFTFLKEAAAIAPTYYSLGNHEVGCYRKGLFKRRAPQPLSEKAKENLAKTGVYLLDNRFFVDGGISICGLSSRGGKEELVGAKELLQRFSTAPGYKILLCHHPEVFEDLVLPHDKIALTVSGHAHGGQWRLFGFGIFSPDQGLFPRYTSGFYFDDRLLVSRGLGDSTLLPRIFNRRELIILDLKPKQ